MHPQDQDPEAQAGVVAATRCWLERAVIGLNLCPFARAVYLQQRVRFVVTAADSPEALLEVLAAELALLRDTDPAQCETTLLIHPQVLEDFTDYNDFLNLADDQVWQMGLTGEIQVASFHPQYQFAGTDPDDVENCSNRSPYPLLHLLREASVEQAVATHPDIDSVPGKNIDTLRELGHEGWERLWHEPQATEKT